MTRVVLISGKGGVGKTTVAAATAARAAELGHSTLAVSLDRAHNLGDVLGTALGPVPRPVDGVPGLFAMEADPQEELLGRWASVRGYFSDLLHWMGVGGVEADEVAVFPGLEELLVLSRVAELVEQGDHELVVVDLAPTASSLRLLSFPELMEGPIGRFAKWERSFLSVFRPAMKRITSAPVPEESLYTALDELSAQLGRLKALLTDPERACVRLVTIPERVVMEETRQAFTLLSLFGLCVDAVVHNRVLPEAAAEGYFQTWVGLQQKELARSVEQFGEAAHLRLEFQPHEVTGAGPLLEAGQLLYGDRDPSRSFASTPPLRFHADPEGTWLQLRLPHASSTDVQLKQRGNELIITASGWRRQLPLPASLHGREVQRARFKQGALAVLFAEPNPSQKQEKSR